ncbi:MAG: hypothetical protein J7518_09830 [Nocardioidaceae bacterium]|nr:hypothetical protein [Nocardioidaceae bacterium]
MTDRFQLPLRILVKGASLGHDVSEFPQQREQFVFPRVIEEYLLDHGRAVEVWNPAVASEMASMGMRHWEEHVKAWEPDVIILTWGYYECVHLILPRWLERHANSLKARPGPIRSLYRKRVLRPFWKSLAELQKALDKKVQGRFFARRSRRIAADIAHFIDRSRKVGRPLILLPEFLVPNKRAQDWFPGMADRAAMVNRDIRAMVDGYDDHVRLLPVPEIAESRTDKSVEAAADGFHYNAEVHQLVGEAYGAVILEWAEQYPRLRGRGETGLPGFRTHQRVLSSQSEDGGFGSLANGV